MLFNSYPFIFLFLPVTVLGFFLLGSRSQILAATWLAVASVAFYGYWNPVYVILLFCSIALNYTFGILLSRLHSAGRNVQAGRLLTLAVAIDLLLLGYYKYANFFVINIGNLTGIPLAMTEIALPLGISFFTFTQIAFLVDARRGEAKEFSFVHYCLFVTYFPHLIAGPILHHGEMMPQFRNKATYRVNWENFAVGLTLFFIGLYKKTVLADGIAEYVAPAFNAAGEGGAVPTFLDAWGAALAYTLQIYFDFSGYSDMAIGLSRLFGIQLPINFDSPYKAKNIIDFWRRWHITLSRFLRDYLYFSLGGNRKGVTRRYVNLFLTMLIGGFWHGAGWTFICWGALHGSYLVINHGWSSLHRSRHWHPRLPSNPRFMKWLTFLAIVVAWVFFRATDVHAAIIMLKGMAGMNGFVMPERWLHHLGSVGIWLSQHGVHFSELAYFKGGSQLNWIWILLLVCWGFPNTQEILSTFRTGLISPGYRPVVSGQSTWSWTWKPSFGWLLAIAGLGLYAMLAMTEFSEFLYFQF